VAWAGEAPPCLTWFAKTCRRSTLSGCGRGFVVFGQGTLDRTVLIPRGASRHSIVRIVVPFVFRDTPGLPHSNFWSIRKLPRASWHLLRVAENTDRVDRQEPQRVIILRMRLPCATPMSVCVRVDSGYSARILTRLSVGRFLRALLACTIVRGSFEPVLAGALSVRARGRVSDTPRARALFRASNTREY